MKFVRQLSLSTLLGLFMSLSLYAADITITNTTAPEIVAAYKDLQSAQSAMDKLDTDHKSALDDNATAMQEKQTSKANMALTGLSTAATGIGGSMLATGMAAQNADSEAAQQMESYRATFSCGIVGGPHNIKIDGTGETPQYSTKFATALAQYKSTAAQLCATEKQLDMPTGTECDELKNTDSLYTNEQMATISHDGAFADTAAARLASGDAKSRENTGMIVAGAGIVGGVVGNAIINKDSAKEKSDEINQKYETDRAAAQSAVTTKQTALDTAIKNNSDAIKKYNDDLAAQKSFVATITDTDCTEKFADYIKYINGQSEITDNTQSVPKSDYDDLATQKSAYDDCVDAATKQRELDKQKTDCTANAAMQWDDTTHTCTQKPVTQRMSAAAPDTASTNEADQNECTAGQTRPCTASAATLQSMGVAAAIENCVNGKFAGPTKCVATSCLAGWNATKNGCEKQMQNCPKISFDATKNNIAISNKLANGSLDAAPCYQFCTDYATKNKCIDSKDHMTIQSSNQCVCNISAEDLAAIAAQTQKRQQAQVDAAVQNVDSIVHDICADGAKNANEKCVEDFEKFQTDAFSAVGLAKQWALVRDGRTIQCSNNSETRGGFLGAGSDDYIKCMTSDQKYQYEFRFNDALVGNAGGGDFLSEGVCIVHGLKYDTQGTTLQYCVVSGEDQCNAVKTTAKNLGITAVQYYEQTYPHNEKQCRFTDGGSGSVSGDLARAATDYNAAQKLNTICGIDNFAMRNNQTRGRDFILTAVRQYVTNACAKANPPISVNTFSCLDNLLPYDYNGDDDDMLRCTVNGNQTIDMVFNDLKESFNMTAEAGRQGIGCAVSGGLYDGKKCWGLTEQQCTQLGVKVKQDFPNSSGVKYIDGQCQLLDAREQTNLSNNLQLAAGLAFSTMAAGTAVITCVGTAGAGCVLGITEAAVMTGGTIGEYTSDQAIQKWTDDFLSASTKCKDTTCAETTITQNIGHLASGKSYFNDAAVSAVDSELARLTDLLPDGTIEKIMATDGTDAWDKYTNYFGSKTSGEWLKWAHGISIGAQVASIGFSMLRAAVTRAAERVAAEPGNTLKALPEGPEPPLQIPQKAASLQNAAERVATEQKLLPAAPEQKLLPEGSKPPLQIQQNAASLQNATEQTSQNGLAIGATAIGVGGTAVAVPAALNSNKDNSTEDSTTNVTTTSPAVTTAPAESIPDTVFQGTMEDNEAICYCQFDGDTEYDYQDDATTCKLQKTLKPYYPDCVATTCDYGFYVDANGRCSAVENPTIGTRCSSGNDAYADDGVKTFIWRQDSDGDPSCEAMECLPGFKLYEFDESYYECLKPTDDLGGDVLVTEPKVQHTN